MFKDKFDFKKEFTTRIVEGYGRSVEESHITERYQILGDMVRNYASVHWKQSKERISEIGAKQMYYFSMEFLIGRLMTINLMNLGIYEVVRDGLDDLGIDINELEELESDAGLGNGGLGRLAACFLDSLATLSLPGHGNCIRYDYGFFKQEIIDGQQVEKPDQWLRLGNVWEVRKPKHAVIVKFWGRINIGKDENGAMVFHHTDAQEVRAVPYDMPVVGKGTDVTNTLRLWGAEPSENIPANLPFSEYLESVAEITRSLYPEDSDEHGKYLRLKQQYFFVSAGLQSLIKAHLRVYPDLDNLSEKIAVQLNDTHPVLAIPELMRLLMDQYHYSWDDAWHITTGTMSYTNHTVLQEALEKWSVEYIQKLLPRVFMIIDEINQRYLTLMINQKNYDVRMAVNNAIIKDGLVHMATLAVVGSHAVNGVARLHTEILKNDCMRDLYQIYPDKFQNKTNGITHRRWLLYSNPQLTQLLSETIGDEFIHNPQALEKLLDYTDDSDVQKKFLAVKQLRKNILADFIFRETGIEIDPASIIDVQAKRLHAYKRQLLNALHIIYLMQQIDTNPEFTMVPTTFIFGAKAAPSYYFAKKVIELINRLQEIVNYDEKYSRFFKVVFIPNYRVSVAELLINASDVSEQISTAGKEASGTGNMKFMMNGALTLGTLDGANVEIDELVTREHDVIFGRTVAELEIIRPAYRVTDKLAADPLISKVLYALADGYLSEYHEQFKPLYDEIIYKNDEYFLLEDFNAYRDAHLEIQRRYQDRQGWAKSCLVNIAKSGFFASDRTISEYAQDIWNLKSIV